MTSIEFQGKSLIVADSVMEKSLKLAEKASKSLAPILLVGESGTGKELFARYIREKSPVSKGPFVSVNCAAIPEGLLEAELFGFERGAFTGAVTQRIGKFERANRGTLLLDEISEMPLSLQAKLLRVLQEEEVDRIGGGNPIPIKTRIISTTNRDPYELLNSGDFRSDLFYRINVVRIDCAPLRNRFQAIEALARAFLEKAARHYAIDLKEITPQGLGWMYQHQWPGNIRELQNLMERASLLIDDKKITDTHLIQLAALPKVQTAISNVEKAPVTLAEMEKRHILSTLDELDGNRTLAAEQMGITTRTLRNKLKLYNL